MTWEEKDDLFNEIKAIKFGIEFICYSYMADAGGTGKDGAMYFLELMAEKLQSIANTIIGRDDY